MQDLCFLLLAASCFPIITSMSQFISCFPSENSERRSFEGIGMPVLESSSLMVQLSPFANTFNTPSQAHLLMSHSSALQSNTTYASQFDQSTAHPIGTRKCGGKDQSGTCKKLHSFEEVSVGKTQSKIS